MDSTARLTAPHVDGTATQRKRRRLGKHLVKQGIVPKRVVRAALEEQERTGHRLGEILVARGAIDSTTLVAALADQELVETVTTADRVVQALPISVAFEHRAVVLLDDVDVHGRAATRVAVTDLAAVPAIWEALGRPVEPKLADPETMERLLSEAYPERGVARPIEEASDDAPVIDEPTAEPPAEDAADVPTASAEEVAEPADVAVAEIEPAEAEEPEASVDAGSVAVADPPAGSNGAGDPTTTWTPPVAPGPDAVSPQPAPAPIAAPARRRGFGRLFGRHSAPPVPTTSLDRPSPNGSLASAPTSNGRPVAEQIAPDEPASEELLPTATLIVGLRQASPATLSRVVAALDAIDYPRERLQVLAVHDPADRVTRRALHDQPMPPWVTETAIPRAATPGPRGLILCGLRQATGELVAVLPVDGTFDADLLREATAEDTDAIVMSAEASGSLGLTSAFLRQAEPCPLDVRRAAGADTARPALVFRVVELRDAFGWPALSATS